MNNNPPVRCGDKWHEYEDNGLLYGLQKNVRIEKLVLSSCWPLPLQIIE